MCHGQFRALPVLVSCVSYPLWTLCRQPARTSQCLVYTRQEREYTMILGKTFVMKNLFCNFAHFCKGCLQCFTLRHLDRHTAHCVQKPLTCSICWVLLRLQAWKQVGWLFWTIKHTKKWLVTSNCHFNATFHPSRALSGIQHRTLKSDNLYTSPMGNGRSG